VGLDIFFQEDIERALVALDRANKRAMTSAITYGMNEEAARLYGDVYAGALADVGAAFGLALAELTEPTLTIPTPIAETRMHTIGCIPGHTGTKKGQVKR